MPRTSWLLPLALLCACAGGEPAGSTVRCEAGTVTDCYCDDGTPGIRTCSDAGRVQACDCRPALELGGIPDPTGVADRLVDFGVTVSDAAIVATVPVRNAGGGELALDLTSVSAPFTLVQAPVFLGPGEEDTLGFQFLARSNREAESIVTVTSNGGAATIRLAGRRAEPRVSCEPAELDLGTIVVGSPVPFAIACRDEAGLSWAARAWASGAHTDAVEVTLDEPLPGDDGAWLLSGTVTADRAGTLWASVNLGQGNESLATVPLRATIRATALEIPEWLDFNLVPPGQTLVVPIELRNHGPDDAWVKQVYVSPESDRTYGLVGQVPLQIPAGTPGNPGETDSLAVRITPSIERAGGRVPATLVLWIEGEAAPRNVALNTWVGGPEIDCAVDRLDFGTVPVGTPSTLSLTCENVGYDIPVRDDDTLVVMGIESFDAAFTAHPQGQLPPEGFVAGESFTFDVTFTPEVEGPVRGTVVVHSNGLPGRPLPIEVVGTGLALEP